MIPCISFDHRIVWQGSSPSEHGSHAELCFKARIGPNTVICRVSLQAILNAFHAHAVREGVADVEDQVAEDEELQLCESLFNQYRQVFRDAGQDKIRSGQFALSFGEARTVLIGEQELKQKLVEAGRAH